MFQYVDMKVTFVLQASTARFRPQLFMLLLLVSLSLSVKTWQRYNLDLHNHFQLIVDTQQRSPQKHKKSSIQISFTLSQAFLL